MKKVSDYVSDFLALNGIKDVFLISGGGMMHLLDSVQKNENINVYCNLNEQATSICADSYAQITKGISAFLVTTGPGGTNAITGVVASWLDGNPVMAISGQVKTSDMGVLKGLRQFGAQEVDIVSMVKPITKYAVTVMSKEDIKYHLQKALFLATHGRKGPVWIDVPLDIQGATIEESTLRNFDPSEEKLIDTEMVTNNVIKSVYKLINNSKRPCFLIGHGLEDSGRINEFRRIVEKMNIPVLATWRAKGVFGDDEELYYGHPGIPTTRFSNYVLQNSDCLIILGTRLNPALTAYDDEHFAYNAKKVIVDLEENEIAKLKMNFEIKVIANTAEFIEKMYKSLDEFDNIDFSNWIKYCNEMKLKYPLVDEAQPLKISGVDGYRLADALSKRSNTSDIFIESASGRSCPVSNMAYKLKRDQRYSTSMGLGSMGFAIPAAIGACIAGDKSRTLVIEGDGSLQHNIQELQLIKSYNLPIKIFVLSNGGYAQIYMMQKNNFSSNFAGCIPENGLTFPELKKIADAYGIAYAKIEKDDEIDNVLDSIMCDDRAVLCEVVTSILFDEIPKSMTKINDDGTYSSSKLEDLYPFLPEEETLHNLQIKDYYD